MSTPANIIRRCRDLSMVVEIGMSMATIFFEFLLIFFGEHRIRYVFATSSLAVSMVTVLGIVKSYAARGRCLTDFERKGCCYFYSNINRDLVWHAPVRTESVRFLYSALSFLAILIDFIRIAIGERVVQAFTAFPAAFASVVFVLAVIDHVVLYTTH